MKLASINLIDASSAQPITLQEDLNVFHAILTALHRPTTDLGIFSNWGSSGTPVNDELICHIQLIVCIQCHLLSRYIQSFNFPPRDLHYAFIY